jgi:predicted nuclease of predicted toxin-antitoxin system
VASKRKLAFLPDHNIPSEIIFYLSSLRKVQVMSFEEINLSRSATDPQVIEAATKEQLLILTADKRFTEDHIPLCQHQGIVKLEVSKPETRLRCLKRFMHMPERHLAWKGVTHLYESLVMLQQHSGERSRISY